ncbi:MAG TPA: NUDIX domain-containing protein, partial [Microlunatus sp.]|nr:NUDIX domain-containing protein [Microlunatus sp.]
MPTPAYITELREVWGHRPLLLPGVSGVVLRGGPGQEQVLLGQRSDNGRWSVPAGIVEPGEQPADSLVRELWEETRVGVVV